MVVKVSDASGEAYLSVFNEQAEKIIGCTADELNEIKSQVSIKKPPFHLIKHYMVPHQVCLFRNSGW